MDGKTENTVGWCLVLTTVILTCHPEQLITFPATQTRYKPTGTVRTSSKLNCVLRQYTGLQSQQYNLGYWGRQVTDDYWWKTHWGLQSIVLGSRLKNNNHLFSLFNSLINLCIYNPHTKRYYYWIPAPIYSSNLTISLAKWSGISKLKKIAELIIIFPGYRGAQSIEHRQEIVSGTSSYTPKNPFRIPGSFRPK